MKKFLDWSDYRDAGMGDAYADIPKRGGDFARAVAVCISSRQCEKTGRGVMCPSYRVTGNPDYTPGGRVRRLKQVLNGESADDLIGDTGLAEMMAACVGCKGCKRECENGVDMAQIKIEYLAQRNALHPPSLRTRLFAHLPRWLHRQRRLAHLVALRNRSPWLQRMGERVLGIASRPLPVPARQPFTDTPETTDPFAERCVVLFVDTFARHFEPAVVEAAVAVLEAGGYRVIVGRPSSGAQEPDRPLCCGRSYLAQGLVEEARREARRVVEALAPYTDAGLPIIGLEPSCLLALRDDYRALGLGEEAERVARHALLFEEFLAREMKAGRMTLPLREMTDAPPILVHGHCHQKAAGAMKSMRAVLKQLPNADFQFIEASCCGGAGSFGYETEHAELSAAMAEQALLPTLRANNGAQVIANGFSCRQQIREGSDHRPRHLALLLRERLAGKTPDAPQPHTTTGGIHR